MCRIICCHATGPSTVIGVPFSTVGQHGVWPLTTALLFPTSQSLDNSLLYAFSLGYYVSSGRPQAEKPTSLTSSREGSKDLTSKCWKTNGKAYKMTSGILMGHQCFSIQGGINTVFSPSLVLTSLFIDSNKWFSKTYLGHDVIYHQHVALFYSSLVVKICPYTQMQGKLALSILLDSLLLDKYFWILKGKYFFLWTVIPRSSKIHTSIFYILLLLPNVVRNQEAKVSHLAKKQTEVKNGWNVCEHINRLFLHIWSMVSIAG